MRKPQIEIEELLTPAEVARLFRVDAKSVLTWANTGRLPCVKTPGGHRRYRKTQIDELLARDHK